MSDEHTITGERRSSLDDARAIRRFGIDMLRKLEANAHKAHWSTVSIEYLMDRVREECDELDEALTAGTKEDIIKECADVANFCMMIADKLKEVD